MYLRTRALTLLLAATAAIFTLNTAHAQSARIDLPAGYASTAEEDLPVMSRNRPEYDAKGVPLGGFRFFPDLKVVGAYETNIFRTQTNTVDDFFVDIAPSFRLQSEWTRHLLEVYGGLNNYNYARNTSENLTDWNVGADGRYDIAGGTSVYANGSASELHEARSSPNVTGFQASPNRYFLYHGEATGTIQPNRLGFTAGGTIDSFDYENTPLIGGGFLNNSDRDYDEYQGFLKAFYDFSPGYSGFFRAAYDSRKFHQFLDRSGFHRSSDGYRVDGGLNFQISHLLLGEAYVGYLSQDFAAPLQDVSGIDYSARLDWLATPLLTVHFQAARTLTQVILAGVSVSDDDIFGVSADYELYRNVILRAHGNYVSSTFVGSTRRDQSPDVGVAIKYLMNRNMSVDLGYNYSERATNVTGSNFHNSQVTLGLNLHL